MCGDQGIQQTLTNLETAARGTVSDYQGAASMSSVVSRVTGMFSGMFGGAKEPGQAPPGGEFRAVQKMLQVRASPACVLFSADTAT